jgi:hypothetical protein
MLRVVRCEMMGSTIAGQGAGGGLDSGTKACR